MSIILKILLTKLLTQKFLTAVFLHIAEYLASKTDNKLDDKLVAEIKKSL